MGNGARRIPALSCPCSSGRGQWNWWTPRSATSMRNRVAIPPPLKTMAWSVSGFLQRRGNTPSAWSKYGSGEEPSRKTSRVGGIVFGAITSAPNKDGGETDLVSSGGKQLPQKGGCFFIFLAEKKPRPFLCRAVQRQQKSCPEISFCPNAYHHAKQVQGNHI